MQKLAIIITHPIQYYVPLFQLLEKICDLKVFYTWGETGAAAKYDPDFKKIIAWDLPLLEGYNYEFITNIAKEAGSHHFRGIINPTLINQIKDFKPDAILVYGWAYQSHLKVLRYFKGKIPIFFRGDSNSIDEQKGLKRILRRFFLSWVYQHIDVAFYVGTANKIYYEKLGIKPNQLIFAPHAVDNNRFAVNRKTEAEALRTNLNIKNDEILILFAGKFETKKNPALLLQAFIDLIPSPANSKGGQNLTPDLQHVHLLFVGNGELEESLKLKVESLKNDEVLRQAQDDKQESLGLMVETIPPPTPSKGGHNLSHKEKIHFMDFQNQTQMPVIYQACDLFCLPSQGPGETWGLAVNEAMATGKPILVSDKVGCGADLVTIENGLIFKSNDIEDLKQKLTALVKDKARLYEMGKSAQQYVQDWSFDKQTNAILSYING